MTMAVRPRASSRNRFIQSASAHESIALVGYTPAYVGKILACLELDRVDVAKETMRQLARNFHPYITSERFMAYVAHSHTGPETKAKAKELLAFWPDEAG